MPYYLGRMRLLLLALIALPCLHTACSKGDGPRSAQAPGGANQPQMRKNPGSTERARLVLDHDFGVVPHGESRTHEFALDLSLLEQPHVPLRVHLECSCGKAELVMRKPDGSERHIDGTGFQRNLPTDEEQAATKIQAIHRGRKGRHRARAREMSARLGGGRGWRRPGGSRARGRGTARLRVARVNRKCNEPPRSHPQLVIRVLAR